MSIRNILNEFQSRQLLPDLTAGLVAGTFTVVIEVSFAALIFSGDLSDHVAGGIGLTLFGAVILSAVVALTSSFPGTVAAPQDAPAAILALVAAAIAVNMPASATADATFVTVVAAIALTSLLTGAFFLALGRFKLGSLVRFVPYPVVGGFIAGTGWLVVQGAISVMTDAPVSLSELAYLIDPDVLPEWLPALLFAVVLLLISRRYSHFLVIPLILLLGVALFFGLLLITNTSVAEASAQGWLLGPFPQQGTLWEPLTPSTLAQVDWSVIFGQFDKIVTVLLISVISLLLNASGLELVARQDIDLDRELQSTGLANLVAGLGGSPAGYLMLSNTVLGLKMGARGRLIGLFTAAVCAAALLFGTSLIALFPRPVLGGLLLFLGLSFLVEWVYDAWFHLPRVDYFLVLVILVIVGTLGFLEGVAAGVGIAVILFVVKYSRINVVKHKLSGSSYHSTVERPLSQRQLLREKGEQLHILQLHGFIFFGTAQNLLNQIRQRVNDASLPTLRFIVLDFGRVSGFDSSAGSSFARMGQLAHARNIKLLFTHLSPEMQHQLLQGGLMDGQEEVIQIFPTLDHAVEWCENLLLMTEDGALSDEQHDLHTQLEKIFSGSARVARFMEYLTKQEVDEGHFLMHQGDAPHSMYFIESGAVSAQYQLEDGRDIRLRSMPRGSVVGEVGLYTNDVRSASVVATQPSVIYRLSADAIRRMEENDSDLAANLHQFIAHLMAERLADNNTMLQALLD